VFRRSASVRIGLSGTGFIASGLVRVLSAQPERYRITGVLTDRPAAEVTPCFPDLPICQDPEQLLDDCDVVIECSGTVGRAARLARAAVARPVPVLTLNAEFQVTLGAAFAEYGTVVESQGDQPGSLAALHREALLMGFEPLVYGSQKGFLDPDPDPAEMRRWAARQGISLAATVAFTDGTKVQIEQALVANGLGAEILCSGLAGPTSESLIDGAERLARMAEARPAGGAPISDYVLQPGGRGSVFVVARHPSDPGHLAYYKMGTGPYHMLERPYHLGHYEVPVSLDQLLSGQRGLLTAGTEQTQSVGAVAKRDLPSGYRVARAIGSFDFRGTALRFAEMPDHMPIGLMEACVLRRPVTRGQVLTWDDVELTDGLAAELAAQVYPAPSSVSVM